MNTRRFSTLRVLISDLGFLMSDLLA